MGWNNYTSISKKKKNLDTGLHSLQKLTQNGSQN